MDLLVGVLLVSLSAGIRAHANDEPSKKRSERSVSWHFDEELEPYAYAGVPTHQRLPIIRLLSPSPKYKFGTPFDDMESTFNYYSYQPIYSASMTESRATKPPEASSDQQLEVIFARASKRGGFTYRKLAGSRPTMFRPIVLRPTPEPIILRVHKYKVVRNR